MQLSEAPSAARTARRQIGATGARAFQHRVERLAFEHKSREIGAWKANESEPKKRTDDGAALRKLDARLEVDGQCPDCRVEYDEKKYASSQPIVQTQKATMTP